MAEAIRDERSRGQRQMAARRTSLAPMAFDRRRVLRTQALLAMSGDLVYVKSARGTKQTSTLTRDAKGILVKIAPS